MQRSKLNIILQLLAASLLIILFSGYQFNIYDQEDHLPQIYKLLNTELYPNDFFVTEYFKNFNIRFFYVAVVHLLSTITGVYLAVTCLYFICIFCTVFYTYKLAETLGASHYESFTATVLICTLASSVNIGLSNFIYSSFIAGTIALPICIYAFYNFFNYRYIIAFAAAGIASLFQVLMGLQVFILMLAAVFVFHRQIPIKKLGVGVVAFIICSAFMLIPILKQQFFSDNIYDQDLITQILTYFRHPHHYIPSQFPVSDYIKYIAVIAIGLITINKLNTGITKKLYAMFATVILGMMVYYIGFEKMSIGFISKTQWFKSSIWLTLFSVIAIITWVGKTIKLSGLVKWTDKYSILISTTGICIAVFILFNSTAIPVSKIQGRYELGNFKKSDLSKMHLWIAENTSIDSEFVIPPDDESFLCEAKRATVVSYKAMIHQDSYLFEWYSRIRENYGVSIDILNGNSAKEIAVANFYNSYWQKALNSGFYVLVDSSKLTVKPESSQIVHQESNWLLVIQ